MKLTQDNFIRTEKTKTGRGALYTMYFRTSYGVVMKKRVSQHQYKSEGLDKLYPTKEGDQK